MDAVRASVFLLLLAGFFLMLAASGCGFYLKTYRFDGKEPFSSGMSEQDVLSQRGNPLGVQASGPLNVWKYFAGISPHTQKNEYYLVWFQDGHVVKWGKTEEEPAFEPAT